MNHQLPAYAILAVSVGLATVLAGCVSAPAPKTSTAPWVPPERACQSDATWQTARAQNDDFSKPLTLDALADIALRNNPASRKAWNEARAAAAQVAQARGYFLPTLTGVAAGTRIHKQLGHGQKFNFSSF